MQIEYKTTADVSRIRIRCDRCGTRVWEVEGVLDDSHLVDGSGAMCLCEHCANDCFQEPVNCCDEELPF